MLDLIAVQRTFQALHQVITTSGEMETSEKKLDVFDRDFLHRRKYLNDTRMSTACDDYGSAVCHDYQSLLAAGTFRKKATGSPNVTAYRVGQVEIHEVRHSTGARHTIAEARKEETPDIHGDSRLF